MSSRSRTVKQEDELSNYEQARLLNVQRNEKVMKDLGLLEASAAIKPPKRSAPKKRKPTTEDAPPPRSRSRRVAGLDVHGKVLPPREAAKTLAEEQATARPDREPYDGVLSLVKHDHDGDYDEEEDRALRTRFVELLIKSGGGDGGGGSNGRGTGKAKKSAGGSKKASKSAAAAAAATASSIGVLQPVAKLKRMKIGDDDVAKVVPERIFSLAIHPTEDKTLVLAGDKWGVVGVWEKESRRPEDAIAHFKPHTRPVSTIIIPQSNQNLVFTSSYDGTVRCMDLVAGKILPIMPRIEQLSCSSIDVDNASGLLYAGMNDGSLHVLDTRAKKPAASSTSSTGSRHQLHEKKIAHVHVNPMQPHLLATASNDLTVAVWDVRMLNAKGGKKKKPASLATLPHGKSVTAAFWSPATGTKLLSTCKDDRLRVWDLKTGSDFSTPKASKQIRHNNNTGRWLTAFKANWIPNSDDHFVVGSMDRPRGIEIYSASSGTQALRLSNPDVQGSVSSLHAFHPTKPVLAGGNSSGRVYIWSVGKKK